MPKANNHALSRRHFLSVALAAGGALTVGLSPDPARADATQRLSEYITVAPDNTITIRARMPEIGQGIKTGLAMIIAEELDADWSKVVVETAPVDEKTFGPQFAGGSMSTPISYDPMRRAGAAVRAMFIQAAADTWSVPVSELTVDKAVVFHAKSSRKLTYGQLVARAATVPVPDLKTVTLKDPKTFTIVGRAHGGADSPKIVAGQPIFGIDTVVPGMRYAVLAKPPVYGAKLKSANLDGIKKLPGVTHAFAITGTGDMHGLKDSVAIVATSWWLAKSARDQLQVEWDDAIGLPHDSATYRAQAETLLKTAGTSVRSKGDLKAGMAKAAKTIEAVYDVPFIPHVTLEPQNCTAAPTSDGGLEIWAPSQTPGGGKSLVAKTLGIPEDKVTVHMVRAGGGFGRRLENDYMVEAAAVAKTANCPVKLLWSREDDVAYDYFRPGHVHSLKAGLDADGHIDAYYAHGVTYTHDGQVAQGAGITPHDLPYLVADNFALEQSTIATSVPTGYLRAPSSNGLAFVHESFLDEIAHAAGRDPLDYRLAMIDYALAHPPADGKQPGYDLKRARAVLAALAERCGWSKRGDLPKGTGMGVATYFSHRGYFAEAAKVRVEADGTWRVFKVWAVGDVGSVIVNPSAAENQVQGSIIDGIGALRHEITFDKGRAVQGNFTDIPMIRMSEAPHVDVHFIVSDNAPTGLGEPALPPVLPAVCNAIFAATGIRVRSLPLAPQALATKAV
ncbi:MAG: xanthine dehydrogenase family protein molybdopterin-binding subunit [Asticcacaulis sp.]|nr:xanthine dehydrogenase family protein molybdopterin-binding subunit [Asticcacaulis sp.]